MMLLRITAPHFVAGIIIGKDGKVSKAAPIVKYMLGWDEGKVLNYANRKGWRVAIVWSPNLKGME